MFTRRSIIVAVGVWIVVWSGAGSDVAAEGNFPVRTGQKIRVKTTGPTTRYLSGIAVGVEGDTLSIGKAGDISIDRVTLNDGESIAFSFPGARYDASAGTVAGTTVDKEFVSLPLSNVKYVHVTMQVGDKRVSTKFTASTLSRRLKGDIAYPQLLWRVPADSIRNLQVWHEAHAETIKGMGALVGLGVGIAIGESHYKAQENDFISWPRGVIIVPTALFCSAIGYFLGKAVAGRDGWREKRFKRRKVQLGVGQVTERDMGVKLALTF